MVAKLLHSPVLPVVCERDILMKILKTALCWQCLRTDQPESSDCTEVLERERNRKGNAPATVFLPIRWSAKQTNKQNGEV